MRLSPSRAVTLQEEISSIKQVAMHIALIIFTLGLFIGVQSQAQMKLLAVGTLDQSRAGSFADLSGLKYDLENGVPANYPGGFGSAIAYASGNTFLALPDRGPNAVEFEDAIEASLLRHPVLNEIGDLVEFLGAVINTREQTQARIAFENALTEVKLLERPAL